MPSQQGMGHEGKAAPGINAPLRPWFGLCLAAAHAIRKRQIMHEILLDRFQGPGGKLRLVEALRTQILVRDEDLAVELARRVTLKAIPAGTVLITQDAAERDLFLILSGTFSAVVNGQIVASRGAGEHVGEMAVVDPEAHRSASVVAVTDSVVAGITRLEFSAVADRYPRLWRRIALELASRLRDGNEVRRATTTASRAA
jgi:CRP/FNR family transcriptional regulator, cyclic AMP receptor protein